MLVVCSRAQVDVDCQPWPGWIVWSCTAAGSGCLQAAEAALLVLQTGPDQGWAAGLRHACAADALNSLSNSLL